MPEATLTPFVGAIPVFNPMASYGAVGDGVADDTAAIQAAINDAGVHGGVVWLPVPPNRYNITATLTNNKDGVWLCGATHIPRIFGQAFAAGVGVRINWAGAVGGGPMIDWGGTVTTAIKGGGIRDIVVNGNSTIGASIGVRLRSVWSSVFERVHVHECSTAMWNLTDNGQTGTDGNNNVYDCAFRDCTAFSNTLNGTGFLLNTAATSNAPPQGATHCVFERTMVDVKNAAAAIDLSSCDDLWWFGTNIAISSGGTAHSIELRGADAVTYMKPCHSSAFFGLYPGTGGIFARAGSGGAGNVSKSNVIYGLSFELGTEPLPTIEAGAQLAYYSLVPDSAAGAAAGYAAGATVATFHSDDTYTGNLGATGYTINGVVAALKRRGILAQ